MKVKNILLLFLIATLVIFCQYAVAGGKQPAPDSSKTSKASKPPKPKSEPKASKQAGNYTKDNNSSQQRAQIDSLRTANNNLNKQTGMLNKSLEEEKSKLRKQADTLAIYQNDIDRLKRENNQLKAKIVPVVDSYSPKSKSFNFDELVKSSTKQSAERDKRFVDSGSEEEKVLDDLIAYFTAQELFNDRKFSDAQTQLRRINRKSESVTTLNDRIKRYSACGDALVKTIDELTKLDGREKAGGDSEIQKMKFNKISAIIDDYMSNNSECVNNQYLSSIILEIIQLKWRDADRNLKMLQDKLK